MNKKVLIPIIIIALLIPAYLLVNNLTSSENEPAEIEENIPLDKSDQAMMDSGLEDTLGVFESSEVPVGAYKYVLTNSTASYVAQKRFFEREDLEVVGTTENVAGAAWFEPENQDLYLEAEVGLESLSTDSSQRDSDVQSLFTNKVASIVVLPSGIANTITTGEAFNIPVTAQVTINGVTQDVEFQVEGTVTENSFTATGEASIAMSDFGIESPSLLNVFTVDDEIALRFDVEGVGFESSDAMMESDDAMMEEDAMENEDAMMEDENSGEQN